MEGGREGRRNVHWQQSQKRTAGSLVCLCPAVLALRLWALSELGCSKTSFRSDVWCGLQVAKRSTTPGAFRLLSRGAVRGRKSDGAAGTATRYPGELGVEMRGVRLIELSHVYSHDRTPVHHRSSLILASLVAARPAEPFTSRSSPTTILDSASRVALNL